jgi:hypothetical protein
MEQQLVGVLDVSNSFQMLMLAQQFDCKQLARACSRLILKHYAEIAYADPKHVVLKSILKDIRIEK